MLIFKDITIEEQLLSYIDENGLQNKINEQGMFFGAFDDAQLFGVCEVFIPDKKAYLGVVHVKDEYSGQGMDDALVRSLFNKLELRGLKYIYSYSKGPLLDSLGFEESEEGYRCDLEELFRKGCSCCGGSHHEG